MTQNTTPIPFNKAVPKPPLEPDRHELKGGERMTITSLYLTTKTKYHRLVKINGLTDGQPAKYFTTGNVIISDCEKLVKSIVMKTPAPTNIKEWEAYDKIAVPYETLHDLPTPVSVLVKKTRGGSGNDYYEFTDPSEA